ncbi:maleylpyruvate isomerase family mycothiol-dependent enzyme [Actinophytocola gossypii]|uniref:Maleylpyruvate isomerase family mycothiol-dependent enzyme n=1 Tax=Actinophytocola gossypii TaxID=2812003 RepID=A0ABT2J6I2_9PSEU|nr:maleylpyruvate isomerase family mycothiol-dependent enzyme [Actinophytocola gossypii]MCT2582879.1 maleylpyruvate isomerase family mycothiol-dependent enzyme [Actinophytocola gossypii]
MILDWTRDERVSLADFFESLGDHEWRVPSLCDGWTVLHVAAHLTTSTRTTGWTMFTGMIRARGNWNRMVDDSARAQVARFTRAELIARLRETAGSPRRTPGAALLDPLADALVHGQDVARPLGRDRPMPVEQTIAALDHVRTSRFYGARKRFAGLRLTATDCAWSAGEGHRELRGPVGDLLMVAAGRPAGLAALSGSGVDQVAAAL